MTTSASLLRAFVAYFDGICDSVGKRGTPSKVQWDKICRRMDGLRAAVAQLADEVGSSAGAPGTGNGQTTKVAEGVDPVPGGATVTAKWKAAVKRELEELGMDGESAGEAMRDKRFVVDLNADPKVYAAKIEAGTY